MELNDNVSELEDSIGEVIVTSTPKCGAIAAVHEISHKLGSSVTVASCSHGSACCGSLTTVEILFVLNQGLLIHW